MAEQSQQRQLLQLVKRRSDQEIEEKVAAEGVETVLERVFKGMADAFIPELAAGRSTVIQYDVATAGVTHSYQLKVADGKCAAFKGASEPAEAVLGLSLPDFLRLVAGKLGGMRAFMTGRLKLSGDMMLAATQENWFRRG